MTLKQAYDATLFSGLPFEPAHAAELTDAAKTLRQLRNFHYYGILEQGWQPGPAGVPALLHPYLDLGSVRHDYPVCLDEQAGAAVPVQSLTELMDGLIQQTAVTGDEGERLKRHVYQLESVIRKLTETGASAGLLGLWDLAAKSLTGAAQHDRDKQDLLRENLSKARRGIKRDLTALGCEDGVAERILRSRAAADWHRRCADWRKELAALIQQIQDILDADFNQSPEALSADHLSKASGTANDEIDFGELSSILAAGKHDYRLPAGRRKRIAETLQTLLRIQPIFAESRAGQTLPFTLPVICASAGEALHRYREVMDVMTDFFRAVNIARLEAGNHYREGVHDAFFKGYAIDHLTESELRLCPQVMLSLRSSNLEQTDCAQLLDILNSGATIKTLLQIEDLTNGAPNPGGLPGWTTRLGNMALALANGYILQTPVSRLAMLQGGIQDGLEFNGPALFCIYTGGGSDRSILPTYLDAAAATESRVFPAFTYNPARGGTLMERLEVQANPQNNQSWTREPFAFRAASGNDTTIELAFTPADFLCCDRRLANQFWDVPAEHWHEQMTPLQDYLALDRETARTGIPYLLTVDEEGLIHRVAVTRAVVAIVLQCLAAWRHLQEVGGINNSYTAHQVALEKARLEAEQQAAIKSLEEQYSRQLDQDLGQLTEEIVQRIAQQLVQGATGVVQAAAGVTARVARPAAKEAAPADAAEPAAAPTKTPAALDDDEGEAVNLDAAYIETPRCTTCDECTKLNPLIFVYDSNKQAYIKDAAAGPYKDIVKAAEKCPVKIIHPGKPLNPAEPHLEDLIKRAEPFM
ncbi:MAG TPA: ferredoxin [Gammaproteobacteria bacterium]|nr:ferredoxin [Gammaproteobacteria bacterium]